MSDITETFSNELVQFDALTFNLAVALPGRASSRHTERAYYRWIDRYLSDMARMQPTEREARRRRMEALPIDTLQQVLTPQILRAWLGILLREGQGKQALGQARASIVTLADLLAEADWIPYETAASLARVRPPKAEEGQRPGRWLSPRQLREVMAASTQIATSENQAIRNEIVVAILCTMALRREELANARWSDLSIQNDRMVLRVHGKGKKTAVIDVPRPVARRLQRWQNAIKGTKEGFHNDSHLVRRLWKGGRISKGGLSTDSIWVIVNRSSAMAGVGHVAPHDLRRSVAGALQESGVPIDKISQLLRHSNVAVTERYLSKLPQVNEGAVMMSDVLGLGDEEDDDWFSAEAY
ncbi:MAG: site-specific integrase [Chloroflexota bacterium]